MTASAAAPDTLPQKTQELSGDALDVLPQPVVIADADGTVVFANREGQSVFLCPRSGTPIDATFLDEKGEVVPQWRLPATRAARDGVRILGEPLQLRCSDGRAVDFLVNAAPLTRPDGRRLGVATFQDVSALREAERLKDDFASVAAHELRAPLTNLKGWGQFAAMKLGRRADTEALTMIRQINRQISRFEHLTDDLLDLSRVQSGNLTLSKSQFDLVQTIHSVAQDLPALWVERLRMPGRSPVLVHGDRRRIEQVVLNLVTNALKYSPLEATVRVTCFVRNGRALVVVADRGMGIPPDDLPHVFDRYYRARNSQGGSGLGLGLYISRKIVERHGGRIRVRPRKAGGTLLAIDIPLE